MKIAKFIKTVYFENTPHRKHIKELFQIGTDEYIIVSALWVKNGFKETFIFESDEVGTHFGGYTIEEYYGFNDIDKALEKLGYIRG